ncbi:MAG: hypothetical protein PVI80_22665, partial [Anaerolineae bacterium]
MYCTTLHFDKRIIYRCLSLLLLVGLLLYPFSLSQAQEVWHEELVAWSTRRWSRCRHHRIVVRRFGFLRRWGLSLLCRLGLIAGLLLWSGWPQRQFLSWALLSLPLVDAVLFLLPLYRPDVLKKRTYLLLARGVHEVYRLALVVLFGQGVSLHACGESRTLDRLGCPLLMGGCMKVADGARAGGGILADGTWWLEMEGRFIFTWKPQNFFEERILLVLLRQIRTPQSTAKRPLLRQEWLAEWFGTHQELISRWQRYVRQGGLLKLNGETVGWVLKPELCQAILDIWVPNFWLSADEVRERLLAEGYIAKPASISLKSIYRAAQETGFAEVRHLLRQIFTFTADGPQWKDKVLVERLFELNEMLIARLQAGEGLPPQLTLEMKALQKAVGAPMTPLKKPLPFVYRWQRALFGQWEEMDEATVRCPHCGSCLVARKENKPRTKKYRDPKTREWRQVEGYRYYCLNPSCPFKTFTDYPEDLRLYSEWTVDTMLQGVMVYMHLRTTYRRGADV